MKKILQIALGIVTSVGGFLEIGSVTTAAQAGAAFGYQLLWAILLGTICLIFLVEMSGRFSAVLLDCAAWNDARCIHGARHRAGRDRTVTPDPYWNRIPVVGDSSLLPRLAADVEGYFSLIEYGVSLLGLVTLSFVVAAVKLHPNWGSAAEGLLPTLAGDQKAKYGFIAVSILGASIWEIWIARHIIERIPGGGHEEEE